MGKGWEAFWSGAGKRMIPWALAFLLGVFGIVTIARAIEGRGEKEAALEDAERLRTEVIPALADSAAAAWDSLDVIGDTVTKLVAAIKLRPIEYVTLTRTIRLKGKLRVDTIPGVVIAGDTVPIPESIRDRLRQCDELALTCQAQTQQIAVVKLQVTTLTDSLTVMGEKYHTATQADINFWFIHVDVDGQLGAGVTTNLLPCSDSETTSVSFDNDFPVETTTIEKCVGRVGAGFYAGVGLSF